MNNFELNEKIEEFVDMYTPYQLAKMYLQTKEEISNLMIVMDESRVEETINRLKEQIRTMHDNLEPFVLKFNTEE